MKSRRKHFDNGGIAASPSSPPYLPPKFQKSRFALARPGPSQSKHWTPDRRTATSGLSFHERTESLQPYRLTRSRMSSTKLIMLWKKSAEKRALKRLSQITTELAWITPDPWPGDDAYEPNSSLVLDDNFLSEDFCVMEGKYFFIRGVALVPVFGMERPYAFGCWTTLSLDNFNFYLSRFDAGFPEGLEPCSGWFSNQIPTFETTLAKPCSVYIQPHRQRPHLVIQDETSEFGAAQRNGIFASRLLQALDTHRTAGQ